MDQAGISITELNRQAWDRAVADGNNPYTQVVTAEEVAAARAGTWQVRLSDIRPVPQSWFPALRGSRVLCLASGGGQQGPILAAAGARVTVHDLSARQLDQDRHVAERDGLDITLVRADMTDFSAYDDGAFDVVVNPPSTLFLPALEPLWRGCHRVMADVGVLMTGFLNPDEFVFDAEVLDDRGEFVVRHPLPYAEHETLDADSRASRAQAGLMWHFSHTMEAQLGGILRAGFVITDFYEDRRPEGDGNPIRHFLPSYYVVRAVKA